MRGGLALLILLAGTWIGRETACAQTMKHMSATSPQASPPGKQLRREPRNPGDYGILKSTKRDVSPPKEGQAFSRSGLPAHSGTNAVFRWIPAGTFQMGSTTETDPDRFEDETSHEVTLTQGFWLLDHEVTQQEYRDIKGEDPSYYQGKDDHPVENVRWADANDFCKKLTDKDLKEGRISPNQRYRLPTEAEWEHACRALTKGAVYVDYKDRDRELRAIAWSGEGPFGETHSVKQKLPNAFGLYDMIGNVQEWCYDRYGAYGSDPAVNPKGASSGSNRVFRGSSFVEDGRSARSAARGYDSPVVRDNRLGFRPALSSSE